MKKLFFISLICATSLSIYAEKPSWKTAQDCELDIFFAVRRQDPERIKKAYRECHDFWAAAAQRAQQNGAIGEVKAIQESWQSMVEQEQREKSFFERNPVVRGVVIGSVIGIVLSLVGRHLRQQDRAQNQ